MSKLILTETQFNRLNQFINETRFDDVVKDTINVGDVVRITYKNTTNNFKVILNEGGQIIMDNIDAGSALINYRYLMTFTSLHGTKLEIRRVNKIKEKDKLKDRKSWTPLVINDVSNIEILRNNQVVDTVDKPEELKKTNKKSEPAKSRLKPNDGKQPYSEENIAILSDVRDRLLSLKEMHMVIFTTIDDSIIFFCAVSKNGLSYELEVAKIEGNGLKYDYLRKNRVQMNFNDNPEQDFLDEILVKGEGDKISLLLKIIEGEDVTNSYLDFKTVRVGGTCEEEGRGPEEDEAGRRAEAKEMMDAIINDPVLKKAFYKQPTLIQTIISAMGGAQLKGLGIGPASTIIDKYMMNKYGNKIGESVKNFKIGQSASFKMLSPTVIKYMFNSRQQSQEFGTLNPYKAIVRNGPTAIELENREGGWKVIINGKVDGEQDVYLADIIKFTKTKDGELKTLGQVKNTKIKMVKSQGYTPTETTAK